MEDETLVYHMTHYENLPNIIKAGALLCDRKAQVHILRTSAYAHLKERRTQTTVPLGPNQTLDLLYLSTLRLARRCCGLFTQVGFRECRTLKTR